MNKKRFLKKETEYEICTEPEDDGLGKDDRTRRRLNMK
jgi:hypothetical protein